MEYIEFDIKNIIHDALQEQIIPYSVELNCELFNSPLNNIYGTNIYHSDELYGKVEVIADFTCCLDNEDKTPCRGHFKGTFNVEHKCFFDGAYEVSL